LEGKKTGPSPVDRRKLGSKISVMCDGEGVPLALAVHPSNQHDSTTIDDILDNMCIDEIPNKSKIYFDKGYDSEHIREGFYLLGIQAIIPRRFKRRGRPNNIGKNRWQVERSFSWLKRFEKLRTRREKKGKNYLSILIICSAWVTLKKVLG